MLPTRGEEQKLIFRQVKRQSPQVVTLWRKLPCLPRTAFIGRKVFLKNGDQFKPLSDLVKCNLPFGIQILNDRLKVNCLSDSAVLAV